MTPNGLGNYANNRASAPLTTRPERDLSSPAARLRAVRAPPVKERHEIIRSWIGNLGKAGESGEGIDALDVVACPVQPLARCGCVG